MSSSWRKRTHDEFDPGRFAPEPVERRTHPAVTENTLHIGRDAPSNIVILQEGWIQGAGIDVFEQEPVDPDNPILRMDNVVVSPHSLGHTDEYFKIAWSDKLHQAAQILLGKIPDSH